MPKKVDILETLLAEAIRYATKSQVLRSDLAAKEASRLIKSSYGNPINWSGSRCIELVHRSSGGELSNLGQFREEFYRGTEARRLTRWTGPTQSSDAVEFVTGDHWLGATPAPEHRYEETPQELLQLKARFHDLMAELDAQNAHGA